MFVLAGGAALRESVTYDELAHIGAGVSYWQTLDMRFNEEHPPLAKLIATLPLALQRTHADYTHISWTYSLQFFPAYAGQWIFGEYLLNHWNNATHILAWARFPMLLLTLALGWVIFILGRRLGGPWGGLLALIAYVTAPVFLVFGPLVLTDIPITLFSLLSLWTFSRLWQDTSRRNILLFALCFAGALLSKFSAVMLFFAFGAFSLSTHWWPVPGQPETKPEIKLWRKTRRRAFYKAVLWATLIVYVVYFVLSLRQPVPLFHGTIATIAGRLLMPPLLYLRGMFMVALTINRPTFLLGHAYPHGIWFYFPVLFFLKSTLGFLGLTALTAALSLYWNKFKTKGESIIPTDLRVHWRVLWISFTIFTALCIVMHLNVCYRHFTIPVALLTLMLAPLPAMLLHLRIKAPRAGATVMTLTVILAVSCLVTVVRQYPYYFPYMNPLTFGRPAYTLMSDANVDWNQSLPEAARFAQQHGVQKLKIDEYGITMPSAVIPGSEVWDCQKPVAEDAGQWVVVSANAIMDVHNCTWLMRYPNESIAQGSMYAVHLPSPIPPAGAPGGPPASSDTRLFLAVGKYDMRQMFQDLIRNPDSFPAVLEQMSKEFKKHFDKGKKK